jgi:hypothetical protein
MKRLGISERFGDVGKYAAHPHSMSKKEIPVACLPLLLFAILSISGCTGIASAPKTATTPGSAGLTLTANTTSLSFSSVNIGSKSTLPVILTNGGNSNVTISNVIISGAGYTASGVSSGQILTSGQAATLNVTFAPAGSGLVPGSVTVASDATNSPATISLSGSGSQLVAPTVALNWIASTSAVAGYNVYRSQTSGGPYTKLDSSIVTADSYTDSSVQAGQTYYYVVTSVTSAGVESADSTQTSATVPTS